MKKIFKLLILALLLGACNKGDRSHSKTQDYENTKAIKVDDNSVAVSNFDCYFPCMNFVEIPVIDLPISIITYLGFNHGQQIVDNAKLLDCNNQNSQDFKTGEFVAIASQKESTTNYYAVTLQNQTKLLFDKDGQHLTMDVLSNATRQTVRFDQLPNEASTFLSEKKVYKGDIKIELVKEFGLRYYSAKINDRAKNKETIIVFSSDGQLICMI